MTSSLSNLINYFAEGIHSIECKCGHDDKKCEKCGIKYKNCECFLEYTNFKDNLWKYKRLCCNKNYQNKFDGNLQTNFLTMISISLCYCGKKVFTLVIYGWLGQIQWNFIARTEKVNENFEIKNLGGYHDLYVQSETSLLADVFKNFWNMCLEIYEPAPAHFLTAPGLAWQSFK